eukprot:366485-Chlamydomonas_euryale.AAC.2
MSGRQYTHRASATRAFCPPDRLMPGGRAGQTKQGSFVSVARWGRGEGEARSAGRFERQRGQGWKGGGL